MSTIFSIIEDGTTLRKHYETKAFMAVHDAIHNACVQAISNHHLYAIMVDMTNCSIIVDMPPDNMLAKWPYLILDRMIVGHGSHTVKHQLYRYCQRVGHISTPQEGNCHDDLGLIWLFASKNHDCGLNHVIVVTEGDSLRRHDATPSPL
jgi:hypothetical protein